MRQMGNSKNIPVYYDDEGDIFPDKWWGQGIVLVLSAIFLVVYAVVWAIEKITRLGARRIKFPPHS